MKTLFKDHVIHELVIKSKDNKKDTVIYMFNISVSEVLNNCKLIALDYEYKKEFASGDGIIASCIIRQNIKDTNLFTDVLAFIQEMEVFLFEKARKELKETIDLDKELVEYLTWLKGMSYEIFCNHFTMKEFK